MITGSPFTFSPASVWPTCLSLSTTCLSPSQAWNVLALDGSNWQKIDLFNFQTDIEVRGCSHEREKKRGVKGWNGQFLCACGRLYVLHVCACWVALSSPRLSAGSVGFGADCDVAADPLSCGSVHLFVHLSPSLCPCVSQGRVVENISKRCGGFLRQLSLRGCLSVGDASMKWDSLCVPGMHWYKKCGAALTFTLLVWLLAKVIVFTWCDDCLKFKQLVPLQSQGTLCQRVFCWFY